MVSLDQQPWLFDLLGSSGSNVSTSCRSQFIFDTNYGCAEVSGNYLDAPATTTSSIIYKVQFSVYTGYNIYFNKNSYANTSTPDTSVGISTLTVLWLS